MTAMAAILGTKFWASVRVVAVILLSFLSFGCDAIMGCKQTELSRIKSPDGKVEAVIVARDCGATTSVSKSIFLVPAGAKLEGAEPMFACDKEDDLNFKWEASKSGVIEYSKARIFAFRNSWSDKRLDNFQYEVQLSERKK